MPPQTAGAGYIRVPLSVYVPLAGAGAHEIATDLEPGCQFTVESAEFVTAVAGTGGGATKNLRVLKGASTEVAQAAITLAGTSALGERTELPVDEDVADFLDSDTLSIDFEAGTDFTAGAGNLIVWLRQRMQAR